MNENETGNCKPNLRNVHSDFIAYKQFATLTIKYI